MRRIIQVLSFFALFATFFYSWLFALTFINRVTIYRDREKYRPATYVVSGAEYSHDSEDGDSWWLMGTIDSREERFIPRLHDAPSPHNAEEVKSRYPAGTKMDVLYNPEATETIMQDETLRVISASPDFWPEEERRRHALGVRVLVPVPLALILYLTASYLNRGRAKSRPQ